MTKDYGPRTGRLSRNAMLRRFEISAIQPYCFGKTGADKSTLINAVFGREVTETGTGPPITTGLNYHEHPENSGAVRFRGFETGLQR